MRFPRAPGLFACALPALIASCGRGEPEEIPVGLNFELTGDIQTIGQSAKNAAELFFERQNAAGGVDIGGAPRKFRVLTRDNGADATQAAAITQRLISTDNVAALIGPNAGHCANAAADIAEALKCVMITPWSPDPATTMDRVAGVPKRYVFRAGATDAVQGRVMATFALSKLGARRAAIIASPGGGASAQAAAFRDTFNAGGGEIVAQEAAGPRGGDIRALVPAIAGAAPQVVLIATPCDQAIAILRAAKDAGLDAAFLGTELWNSPRTIEMTGLGLENLYFCKNFQPRDADPAAEEFSAAYTEKYGQPPDDVAALTHDACALVVAALQKSGKNDREALREALAALRGFEGMTGTYDFKPGSGDPAKSMPVVQIKSSGLQWAGDSKP